MSRTTTQLLTFLLRDHTFHTTAIDIHITADGGITHTQADGGTIHTADIPPTIHTGDPLTTMIDTHTQDTLAMTLISMPSMEPTSPQSDTPIPQLTTMIHQ